MEQTLLSIEHLKKSYDDNLILDDITTGASQDIKQATQMAKAMGTKYGMSSLSVRAAVEKVRCFDVSTLWNQFRAARSN